MSDIPINQGAQKPNDVLYEAVLYTKALGQIARRGYAPNLSAARARIAAHYCLDLAAENAVKISRA